MEVNMIMSSKLLFGLSFTPVSLSLALIQDVSSQILITSGTQKPVHFKELHNYCGRSLANVCMMSASKRSVIIDQLRLLFPLV